MQSSPAQQKLGGEPDRRFGQLLEDAGIDEADQKEHWHEACGRDQLEYTNDHFEEVMNVLLEKPNLNSTHLFRADILFDSTCNLQTTQQEEFALTNEQFGSGCEQNKNTLGESSSVRLQVPTFWNFRHKRTVLRRLIPRKPQLDKPLTQICFLYGHESSSENATSQTLVVYKPDADLEDIPWYHPKVKGLAYLYDYTNLCNCRLSVHYLLPQTRDLFPTPDPSDRLHRTFHSLLNTTLRLLKMPRMRNDNYDEPNSYNSIDFSSAPSALKDTILPQNVVQDTYSALKQRYAADLISRWKEKTEPSKHVFEDLSIAAFLIELWKGMYSSLAFPGFVDIACGNGVLVYVLNKEGYHGYGFDARRRKTWEELDPKGDYCNEMICIPLPFLHADENQDSSDGVQQSEFHDGLFEPGTFIISNHADELTLWTPILAMLSNPSSPLPFLAIPCCSHRLDGSKYRYTIKDVHAPFIQTLIKANDLTKNSGAEEQPVSGDLRALRAAKAKAATHNDDKSMYACLTRKTVAVAQELGFETEVTLMRIPSTRNIGLVGNRIRATAFHRCEVVNSVASVILNEENSKPVIMDKVSAILDRECAPTGGVEASARHWLEKAKKLQSGHGRGKVNWGSRRAPQKGVNGVEADEMSCHIDCHDRST